MTQLLLTPPAAHARMIEGFQALEKDLVHSDGPRISTMRAYRFAILQYDPSLEYEQREAAQTLSRTLIESGWYVLPISLQQLLHDRVRKEPRFAASVTAMEKAKSRRAFDDGLDYLRIKLEPLIEGDGTPTNRGLAGDISARIAEHIAAHPDRKDRLLVLIGRVGALYPFFRVSALLRHLDGHTHDVPVVILYPGTRDAQTPNALSFMGVLPSDSDYRPRIYP
jgi:hypothetical protein